MPSVPSRDRAAWNAHLNRLGISALKVNPIRVIATKALVGSLKAHGFSRAVIVSDDAGQFMSPAWPCWSMPNVWFTSSMRSTDAQRPRSRMRD